MVKVFRKTTTLILVDFSEKTRVMTQKSG